MFYVPRVLMAKALKGFTCILGDYRNIDYKYERFMNWRMKSMGTWIFFFFKNFNRMYVT